MQILLPTSEQALPGRDIPIQITNFHFVNGNPIIPPFDEKKEYADFALGCFGERKENSGKLKMFFQLRLDIWVDLLLTHPMKRFVRV